MTTGRLFGDAEPPLAARMRPRSLDELVGQQDVVGPGTPLRTLIERDELRSAILWGPAGTGKTTIAHIVAERTASPVEKLSAVSSGVKDVRRVIASARDHGRTVLFLDEIHRFNRAQQDAFLGAVEDGVIILVGATTENPFFEVNAPLISRSLVFHLEPLTEDDVKTILGRALTDDRGLAGATADDDALDWIAERAGGDARAALNALEAAFHLAEGERVTLERAKAAMPSRLVRYDKAQTRHYDVISAFIKSMRGSDPDAALYWLAEMLEGGEDPRFICRRMIIFASEDVGMADSGALQVAVAAAHALEHVGLPEAQLNMAHAAIYLATAPKSAAVVRGIGAATRDARERGREVPKHLREAGHPGVKEFGHGVGYEYPHDYPGHTVEQSYRPPEDEGKRYYEPDF